MWIVKIFRSKKGLNCWILLEWGMPLHWKVESLNKKALGHYEMNKLQSNSLLPRRFLADAYVYLPRSVHVNTSSHRLEVKPWQGWMHCTRLVILVHVKLFFFELLKSLSELSLNRPPAGKGANHSSICHLSFSTGQMKTTIYSCQGENDHLGLHLLHGISIQITLFIQISYH